MDENGGAGEVRMAQHGRRHRGWERHQQVPAEHRMREMQQGQGKHVMERMSTGEGSGRRGG